MSSASDLGNAAEQLWDVIVVGTGMGGATVGHALAKRGLSVLFLEKGRDIVAAPSAHAAEASRTDQGWWPVPITERRADGRFDRFDAPIGCAVGGSSIHYAAALERMAPSDFDALTTAGQSVPAWPVPFDAFEPFYRHAEALYRVPQDDEATADARLSEWDRALRDAMRANGLHPKPLQVAMRYDRDCEECVGRICPRRCKMDARTACLDEALRESRCRLIDDCDVQALDADASRVRVVRAMRRGEALALRARVVVLAAGALHSPQILLRSRNAHWPNGLANSSDQVGRNLMFHTADIYALWAPRRFDRRGRQKKALSIRDFYVRGGRRLGYVQSMGLDAGRGEIAGFLKDSLRRHGIRNELLLKLLVKIPSHAGAWLFGEASVFAAMSEDDPDPDNRIELAPNEPDGAAFRYRIADDLRQRADALFAEFTRHVRPWRVVRVSRTLTMNHGHPCGTCRFGTDPATSVLDPNCRAHDLANLFVVDASFMPRSGAINPSLTIAANALRTAAPIADVIAAESSNGAS